tara:strand:+ start:528 stop:746 length:219 start_codon:yes stop_codon:yes gene_type:complete
MNLLEKLQTEGSTLSNFTGDTPTNLTPGGTPDSKLHFEYSINGTPGLPGFPTPSELDLNGQTPEKYLDNLPE